MKWMTTLICLWMVSLPKASEPIPVRDSSFIRLLVVYPRLGFLVSKMQSRIPPTQWEQERFGVLSKNSVFIKSLFPSGLGKDHFYRFTITEETFEDSAHAKTRLDSLRVDPPDLSVEQRFLFPLRRGYQLKNSVVTIHTDVSAYKPKMEQLRDCLRRIDAQNFPKQRKRILDSVSVAIRKPLEK